MLSWKTLLFAAPVAVSLLAANNAHAEWGHGGGEHEHFDRGGYDHRDFDRRFEHHDFDDRFFFFFRDGRYSRRW